MSSHGHVRPNPSGSVARCGGPRLCRTCRVEAWTEGRMRHTDACQMNVGPPPGFPFESFSCNCNGVYLGPVAVDRPVELPPLRDPGRSL